ncbi:MAG: 6,7-dimethyl-8-ribityllumazine synthase [Deltaproteobacteria bacterium]|nr:6,7-dimethyl-8-ribityllumazine synthase [Deltaproteobacteria bacterium]
MNRSSLKFGIVVSEFNSLITDRLLLGAQEVLHGHHIADDHILVTKVPGSFEIPLALQVMIGSYQPDALVALGCLIRGETAHFDLICQTVVQGIEHLSLKFEIPIGFGIIAADTLDQAMDRSGGKVGNLGKQATQASLEMLQSLNRLKQSV